jgi:hypothetical protein
MSVNGGPNIFDTSLLIFLDAADRDSYTPGSTTWYDLSGNNNNFTLYNGVGFNSKNKGYLTFDGTNDYCRSTNTVDLTIYTGGVVHLFGGSFQVTGTQIQEEWVYQEMRMGVEM